MTLLAGIFAGKGKGSSSGRIAVLGAGSMTRFALNRGHERRLVYKPESPFVLKSRGVAGEAFGIVVAVPISKRLPRQSVPGRPPLGPYIRVARPAGSRSDVPSARRRRTYGIVLENLFNRLGHSLKIPLVKSSHDGVVGPA